MDDWDEDVVLEGSPLEDYLNRNHKTASCEERQLIYHDEKSRSSSASPKHTFNFHNIEYFLKNFIIIMFTAMHEKFIAQSNKKAESFSLECIQKILNCKVMLEDDLDYLCLHNPSIILYADQISISSVKIPPIIYHLSIAVAGIAIIWRNTDTMWIQLSISLLTALVISNCVRIQVRNRKWRRLKNRNVEALQSLLCHSEEFQILIRKCLRFIQEMEIAAMGYTLISGNTPINRLERSKQKMARECIQLRNNVLKASLKSILMYRQATLQLLKAPVMGPASKVNSKSEIYMCHISLQDLGPCFDETASFDEMAVATDNFCLDVLRDTNRFLGRQCSEFLRCLSVTLYDCKDVGFTETVFESLNKTIIEQTDVLQDSFINHRNLHDTTKSSGKQTRCKKAQAVEDPLYLAVHSIQVHLRAALNIAIQSEDFFKENESYLEEHLLPQIKIHLDASKQCWLESIKEIEKSKSKEEEPVVMIPQEPVKHPSCEKGMEGADDSLLRFEEDFTEDQVFEATTEYQNDPAVDTVDGDEDAFLMNRRKRIDETEHVMRELKSVLHVKTSDKEREIRKGKLFPNYKPKVVPGSNLEMAPLSQISDGDSRSVDTVPSDAAENFCHGQDFVGGGDLPVSRHNVLKVLRRPNPPGKIRRKQYNQKVLMHEKDKSEVLFAKDGNKELPMGDQDNSESENICPVPLGLGFSSILARQAASIASSNRIRAGVFPGINVNTTNEETTFGDSDSE